MHVVFIPYGIKNVVDLFLENLNQRLLPLRVHKKGEKDQYINIQCQIRYMPFGFVEFVFPKEYKDQVLTAMNFKKIPRYVLDKKILGLKPINVIKKVLDVQDIPEYKETKGFPLLNLQMGIIPIGVREDKETTENTGKFKGWSHEAI